MTEQPDEQPVHLEPVTAAAFNEGDLVEIKEGRPISKTKAWYVSRLLEANKGV